MSHEVVTENVYTYKCTECFAHQLQEPEVLVIRARNKAEADKKARRTYDEERWFHWTYMKNEIVMEEGWVCPNCTCRLQDLLRHARQRAADRNFGRR